MKTKIKDFNSEVSSYCKEHAFKAKIKINMFKLLLSWVAA